MRQFSVRFSEKNTARLSRFNFSRQKLHTARSLPKVLISGCLHECHGFRGASNEYYQFNQSGSGTELF